MFTWLKKAWGNTLAWLAQYFDSARAREDAAWALEKKHLALPFIQFGTDILVGLTPTGVDDAAWALVKAKYPQYFSPNLSTDVLKANAFIIVSELFEFAMRRAGELVDTTRARLAVQMAYSEQRAKES